jgi:hypothetical protein
MANAGRFLSASARAAASKSSRTTREKAARTFSVM